MSVLFLLIAVSLVFASGFLVAFIWAMRDRQFEDDHTPAVRMLFDALPSRGKSEVGNQKSEKSGKGTLFCDKVRMTSPDPSLPGRELRGQALSSPVPRPSSL